MKDTSKGSRRVCRITTPKSLRPTSATWISTPASLWILTECTWSSPLEETKDLGSMLTLLHRVVFLNYREDGVTPYVIIWKHGLTEMKV